MQFLGVNLRILQEAYCHVEFFVWVSKTEIYFRKNTLVDLVSSRSVS